MEQPYSYIRRLQQSFDYRRIPFGEEYYETVPQEELPEPDESNDLQWNVYYDTFWKQEHTEEPCEEISVEKWFHWADREWYIPSVYTCRQGVVLEILLRVDGAAIRAFLDQWGVTPENEHEFAEEQRQQIERENPLTFHFRGTIRVNGAELHNNRGCAMVWIPDLSEHAEKLMLAAMQHYHLNPSDGWVIQRSLYPWDAMQLPKLRSLELTMTHQPMLLPGTKFTVEGPGEMHTVTNPVTGMQHILTVQKFERQEQCFDHSDVQHMEFPRHYIAMTFTLEPDVQERQFCVRDSATGDAPRIRPGAAANLQVPNAACVGMIGGTDGPIAFTYGMQSGDQPYHAACSALRFKPFDTVQWQIFFRERQERNMTVTLL
ncbi:hypothetical protein ACTQ33_08220 [Candidatus Avoscillospira sp. LCP25S3_F1]|uniref:hypothetical protein n=1 Tax=Candidatus Avoscillospira sp. LCP25S3_F1 TaxID=3438825 RepID=UPI003F919B7A